MLTVYDVLQMNKLLKFQFNWYQFSLKIIEKIICIKSNHCYKFGFSGQELLEAIQGESGIPDKGGQKDYAPDGSWLDNKRLESFYRERRDTLCRERIHSMCDFKATDKMIVKKSFFKVKFSIRWLCMSIRVRITDRYLNKLIEKLNHIPFHSINYALVKNIKPSYSLF